MLRKIPFIMIFILLVGCDNKDSNQSFSFLALNTTCTITLLNSPKIDEDHVESIVINIEKLMSAHTDNSDIAQINSGKTFKPDDSTLNVIKRGLFFSKISNGIFDISIGPLSTLWNIEEREIVPTKDEVDGVLSLIDYRNIFLNDDGYITLLKEGMSLDLGAIAKGYAADRVKEYLLTVGVESAIINLGGNINLIGKKVDLSDWRIGIQHPRKDRGEYIGIVSLNDTSLVSSGDYERYFEQDGQRYHHILNGRTGYPVKGEFISSSILYPISMDADALSTITFGSNLEQIKELRGIIPFSGIHITEDKRIYISEDIVDIFTLKDDSYRLITY